MCDGATSEHGAVVDRVDARARLLTVGGATYRVNVTTTTSIYSILPGNVVEVQYIVNHCEAKVVLVENEAQWKKIEKEVRREAEHA